MKRRRRFAFALASALVLGCGSPQPPGAPPNLPGQTPAAEPDKPPSGQPITVVEVPPAQPDPEPVPEPAGPLNLAGNRDWPMFHGSPDRRGLSPAAAIHQPRVRWKAKVGIQGWLNSPIAVGTLAMVPSSGFAHNKPDPDDGVVALDLASGKKVWQAKFAGDANGAAATKHQVFASSDDGNLYALDIQTGKVLWKQPGQGKMYTHPLPFQGRVIAGDSGGYVRAFDAKSGAPLWELQLIGSIRGGAAADEKHIYVTSQGGEAAKLDATGKVVWRVRTESRSWDGKKDQPVEVYSPPILSESAVIVPFARDTYYRDQPGLMALDKRTGKPLWRAKGPGDWGNIRSTPALIGGVLVYAEPYSGDIVGISSGGGRMLFRTSVGACFFPAWASAVAVGTDVVYVPRFDGVVHAVRITDGTRLWQLYLGDSKKAGGPLPKELTTLQSCEWDVPVGFAAYSPAAVTGDGTLLVGTSEGFLYAIDDGGTKT